MQKVLQLIILCGFPLFAHAAFGVFGSAVYIEQNGATQFYNCFGNNIGSQPFSGSLGVFVQNSATFKIQGAELKTWKDGNGNVCGGTLYYRTFLTSNGPSGAFAPVSLPFFCNCVSNAFPCGGGACSGNDQKWQKPGGGAAANIDLTTSAPGEYTLELYYDVNGNANGTSGCPNTQSDNNGGFNYTATYTIQTSLSLGLMQFSAKAAGSVNELYWKTSAEASISYIELQSSRNADNWTILTSQQNPSPAIFQYTDANPDRQTYYRLQYQLKDEQVTYSPIIQVNNFSHKIDFFPNPCDQHIRLLGVEDPINTHIIITDLLGKEVLSSEFCEQLDVTNISSGTYILKIINYQNNTSFTARMTRL